MLSTLRKKWFHNISPRSNQLFALLRELLDISQFSVRTHLPETMTSVLEELLLTHSSRKWLDNKASNILKLCLLFETKTMTSIVYSISIWSVDPRPIATAGLLGAPPQQNYTSWGRTQPSTSKGFTGWFRCTLKFENHCLRKQLSLRVPRQSSG